MLLPVCNGAAYIAAAIESILAQTFRDLRILVIDDGSTDTSRRIARWYARMDARLTVFEKPHTGLVDTLNYGLTRVESPFVARMDADDIAFRGRIEQQLEAIRFSGCDAISGGFIAIGPRGELGEVYLPDDVTLCDPSWLPAKEPYLPHSCLFFRTAAVLRLGGYRFVLHAEDADLYWRLIEHGHIDNIPDVLGKYRQHGASVSGRDVGHGRVQAVFSQAAAISRMRRVAGLPDLAFTIGLAEAQALSASLEDLCLALCPQLAVEEYHHLCAASGLKLLQLARWRPYEIAMADVDFTRCCLDRVADLRVQNRQDAMALLESTQWRLNERGM